MGSQGRTERGMEPGRLRALERAMVKVRWFGVAFALFQIFMGDDPPCPPGVVETGCEPDYLRGVGYGLAAGLVLANVAALFILRKAHTRGRLFALGLVMFLVDHAFLIAYTWLYSFGETTTIWIILYILPLEGALRYSLTGALSSTAIASLTEIARDFYREATFGYEFVLVPGTTFRLGILTIIALVAGIMARNLKREREEVERRAAALEELAEKERAARSETQAFYLATLAGVSTGDQHEAAQRMVETMGETLGYDSLALGLVEESSEGPRIRVVAGYRYPPETIGKTLRLDEGVCGPVARTGEPALISDVEDHPGYLDFAPWARSEMAVPLQIGDRIIGVLNVESPRVGAFADGDLKQLTRLAAGVAVVVENARVLATERQAVERLTELDEMKSDFVALTSHELRTPLTSIRGFIKTLRRPELDSTKEQMDEYLEAIDRQSERLYFAIEDLLTISQLERDAVRVHRSTFDLGGLLEEAIVGQFEEERHRIAAETPPTPIILTSDRQRLRRVLESLIDNALKFSPPASKVSVRLLQQDRKALIEIADRGIGIPESELERIFDRFHQVGGPMGRSEQGFGLGLYICKRMVESIGGDVSVDSRPGEGATFTVILPDTAESPSALRVEEAPASVDTP